MRNGGKDAGTSDLQYDIFQYRRHLFCGEFECDGKTRCLAGVAKHFFVLLLVHFHHDAVKPVLLMASFPLPFLPETDRVFYGVRFGVVRIYLKAEFAQVFELLRLRLGEFFARLCHVVDKNVELARGGYFRIKLADGAGGRIARIRERRFPFFLPPPVQLLQIFRTHPHFSLNDNVDGPRERKRHRFYRPHIVRNVLAYEAIPAGGRGRENAFFVLQDDFQAVYLQLAYVCGARMRVARRDELPYTRIELPYLLRRERVVERPLRYFVVDLTELRQRLSGDALRRRVRRDDGGMGGLYEGELVLQ